MRSAGGGDCGGDVAERLKEVCEVGVLEGGKQDREQRFLPRVGSLGEESLFESSRVRTAIEALYHLMNCSAISWNFTELFKREVDEGKGIKVKEKRQR